MVQIVIQKSPSEAIVKLRLPLVVGRHIITMMIIPTMELEITNTISISEIGLTEVATRKKGLLTEKMAKLIEIVREQLSMFGNNTPMLRISTRNEVYKDITRGVDLRSIEKVVLTPQFRFTDILKGL